MAKVRWKVPDEIARDLFGGVSNGTFYKMKRDSARTLSADELLRISYLVGIFKALHVLYSEALADQWMSRPNTNPIFGGRTPLEYVRAGGIPAMQAVRRLQGRFQRGRGPQDQHECENAQSLGQHQAALKQSPLGKANRTDLDDRPGGHERQPGDEKSHNQDHRAGPAQIP